MEGVLNILNFQIPNVTMGCIKSAKNTQGATFQPLGSERNENFCLNLNQNQSNIYGNFNKFPFSLLQDK
jgi:hypothetical protein